MSDSVIYDSNSDLSPLSDENSSEEETLGGTETPEANNPELRAQPYYGGEQTQTASQAAKAIEAAEERNLDARLDITGAGPSQSPYASPIRTTAWNDDMPVLDAGPAPPDYFAATAWRRSTSQVAVETPADALPAQQDQQDREGSSRDDGVTLPRESRSRQDPTDDEVDAQENHRADSLEDAVLNETAPLLGRSDVNGNASKRNKKRPVCAYTLRQCCLAYAIFVPVLMLVAALTVWIRHHSPTEIRKHASSHGDPARDHPATGQCTFDSYSSYVDIPFEDPMSFSLLDDIELSDNPGLKNTILTGNVEVVYVSPDSSVVQKAPIVVRVHMATVRPWTVEVGENITYYKYKNHITFAQPPLERSIRPNALSYANNLWTSPPCLDILILIYVRVGTAVESWDISLLHFNFVDHESALHESNGTSTTTVAKKVDLLVKDQTNIYSEHGEINLSHWSSNDTRLRTHHGSITGTYQLHRYMTLGTHDGSIDVWIDPIQEDRNSTSKAMLIEKELHTSTTSGQTKVKVRPQSIYLNLSHLVNDSSAHTTSLADTYELEASGALEDLLSIHTSDSGSISLNYPSEWQGIIFGHTVIGEISISGDDVEIAYDGTYRGVRTVEAHHGVGSGVLISDNWSGRTTVLVGNEEK